LILAGIVSCGRQFSLDRRLIGRVAGRAGETDFPGNQLMSTRQQAPIPLALSRNMPEGLKTIVADCLAHRCRYFVDVAANFPEECLYVLNNICEQALKKAILHRKNAYFYKTENGARVGDLFMSLIHTCELNKANPFEYLTQLQKHAGELSSEPDSWMPWNYRDMLQRTNAP